MKVVHVCSGPLATDHPDYHRVDVHPGRWVLNLAKAQRQYARVDAELLVQVPGSKQNYETEVDGVPVHYLAAPDRFRSATLFQLDAYRIAKRLRSLAPAIAHGHGTEDAYALAVQSSGLRNVLTAQGLYFQLTRKWKARFLSRARAVQFAEWLAFKRARHVICKSEYVEQELKARFPRLRLHSIPNTFDERLLKVQVPRRGQSLVFVGTISPHKGVHTLVEALVAVRDAFPEVTLDVIGDSQNSPCAYEIEQKKLLREALGERVIFHGVLDPTALAQLVGSAQALVAPSAEDMFGNQLVEALILRTHGLVAEGTALAENVRRFGNGTVVPQENAKALAKGIIEVLATPPSEVDAERAREAVVTALSAARVAELHLQVYEQVLSEEPVL